MIEVVIVRVIFALLIFSLPLFGGILAIVIDYFDLQILSYFNHGDLSQYQQLDKLLDLLYLAIEAYVVLSWKNKSARNTALILFFWRLLGVLLFEYYQYKPLLVVFPNVFEFWFLTYLSSLYLFKKDHFQELKVTICVVLLLLIPKLLHEYFLHINTAHPWSQNKYIQIILES
jgi:hypothetical protein